MTIAIDVSVGAQHGFRTVIANGLRVLPSKTQARINAKGDRAVLARCVCGFESIMRYGDLRKGKACHRHSYIENPVSRGVNAANHRRWEAIRTRCYNSTSMAFKDYGQRGIKMYEPWINDSRAFVTWLDKNLGPCPPDFTLDRIDNNGDYEPGNLRWASRSTQQRNKRSLAQRYWESVEWTCEPLE